jgi:hypothetical protein
MQTSARTWAALALSLPVVLAVGAVLGLAVADRAGFDLGSGSAPRNVAEAAALGRAADVVRLLRDGTDPAAIHPVRAEIIGPSIRLVTVFEAAVWSGRVEMLRLLEREGVRINAPTRQELACLSVDLGQPAMTAYLVPANRRDCEPGGARARIESRTTGVLRRR